MACSTSTTPAHPAQDSDGPVGLPAGCRGILVVDDNEDIRECLRDVLEDAGYHVCTATNGKDALERLREVAPCLIVLDLMMPIMSGAEFLAVLREHETLAPTPVIVVSACPGEAQAIDAQGVVPKPVDVDALLGFVARFC